MATRSETQQLRNRRSSKDALWTPSPNDEWDPNLPYGGKVYLARKKKPDPLHVRLFEGFIILLVFAFCLYAYYYFDNLHFHVIHGYAHLGYEHAQHLVGQRYLYGHGVEKHEGKAMEWFKKAADQGHPHASYNLAVGHLNGLHTLPRGEAHRLVQHAAQKGVPEAHHVLSNICSKGGCE
ncbi:uncharacterized protein LOC106165232 [Lingula anatina]|uniref:Uncharacterized protein LOC106158028 n=1 Tax=Lingula anatina TaxID=7574 RepID=A0A1S3HTE6_LINAN|nr:uncharacterized protein LOC106158028 [Lingula anatina]XP_013398801.1 uncharacterized protein LOC106165232 [Lingula anatina]|eukprot:XP_013389315.1 uncharacterized protein LOC106158028 [Lingula anatina]